MEPGDQVRRRQLIQRFWAVRPSPLGLTARPRRNRSRWGARGAQAVSLCLVPPQKGGPLCPSPEIAPCLQWGTCRLLDFGFQASLLWEDLKLFSHQRVSVAFRLWRTLPSPAWCPSSASAVWQRHRRNTKTGSSRPPLQGLLCFTGEEGDKVTQVINNGEIQGTRSVLFRNISQDGLADTKAGEEVTF